TGTGGATAAILGLAVAGVVPTWDGAGLTGPAIVLVQGAGLYSTYPQEAADESGWTALHHAAKRGSVEIVRQLLDHEANIDAVTLTSSTAASVACSFGHKDVLSVLAERGANLNFGGDIAGHPLQVTIRNWDEGLVDVPLSNGVSANTVFSDGSGALHYAIRSLQIVKMLLEKKADPNMADKGELTPLQLAVVNGDLDVVKALIGAGAIVARHPDSDGEIHCPLQAAVANNQLSIAKLLLEYGASLDRKTKGSLTALLLAVETQSQACVKWLLDMGASMQCIGEDTQLSLFDLAAQTYHREIMQLLVRRGCFQIQTQTDATQPRGSAAAAEVRDDGSLVMLAYNNDSAGVGNLLGKASGRLPAHVLGEALHAASARGHLPIVKTLLKSGAQINIRDINGRTALHYATRHLHHDVIDILVDNGASISIEDAIGSTPIDLAVVHGKEAIGFIQKHMDNFTLNISRRPSLAAVTPNQSANLSVMGARKAISGLWTGHYEYLSWMENEHDPFSIDIPIEPPQGSRPCTFASENEDIVGPFQFHGFVDPIGTVWFVKLYKSHGWLYRGQVNPDKGILKGMWGSNRKLWFGTFQLRKEK
ncbi:MAG: hypothetical protein Q9187_004208, partial [Circinaria calcarea]